jgi:hypothetical protein
MNPPLDIKCGPLLRYVATDYRTNSAPEALYTIMLVTNDGQSDYSHAPVLAVAGIDTEEITPTLLDPEILHKERTVTFWRWKIYLPLIAVERRLAYKINESHEDIGWWVPGAKQSMRAVFYSCNGILRFLSADDQASASLSTQIISKAQIHCGGMF